MSIQQISLTAAHLGCSRDESLLFKPVSFNIAPGSALMVLGANGMGKTTLLRVLAGLLPPACGQINSNQPIKQNLAYLGPHNAVKGALTPREQLAMSAIPAEVDNILMRLHLSAHADKPCAMLSSGQKQRVALARIALSGAALWILDEPINALDKVGEQIFIELLNEHLAQKGIAIIATHQTLVASQMQTLTLEA